MSKIPESPLDERVAEKSEENEEDNKMNHDIEEIKENTNIKMDNGNSDYEEEKDYQNISQQDAVLDISETLPFDELLILFSWLPLDDLITVRRVCHNWRVAAQDKSVWRNRVLNVNHGDEFERKIKLMPNIQNIKGWAHNSLLDTILENINQLKRLDVQFHPPISPSQVRLVLEKYPQIESITVGAFGTDILANLELLKRSPYLKEVKFSEPCANDSKCPCSLSDVLDVFADSNNFPALTALNLPNKSHFEYAINNTYFRDAVTNIIKSRSQQLSSLIINGRVKRSPEILDAISKCTNLQTLDFCLHNSKGNLNIQKMTQLRQMNLGTYKMDLNFYTTLQDSLYNCSWLHLTKVDIQVLDNVPVGLLRAIVDNAKCLESLRYLQNSFEHCTVDQLENINTLLKLKNLDVECIKSINETCIYYISKCHSLIDISLEAFHLPIGFKSYCMKNMLLELNNLQSLYIGSDTYKYLHLRNRQEIERHIDSLPQDCVPDLTNKLTPAELLILFSWLPVDDLITVRRVCHSWRVAAQDKTLWKNCVLHVDNGYDYERKMKLMPEIENIKGRSNINLLDVILENVSKLKKLNVKFDETISPLKIRQILEKYPQIESISLNACDPNILECLEMLKSSTHLKEIKFYGYSVGEEYKDYTSDFMYIFTDINNFPSLITLSLPYSVDFDDTLKYVYFMDILSHVITTRSRQLSVIKLSLHGSDISEIFNAISICTNLQSLLIGTQYVNANLNIQKMTQLRSFNLTAHNEDSNFFITLQDSLYNVSWSHLTKVDINLHVDVNVGLLRAIIDNAKRLKILNYEDFNRHTSDNQLKNINTLLRLEVLQVRGIQNINEASIFYIIMCYNLKIIHLASSSSDIRFNSHCIKDLLLKFNNLRRLILYCTSEMRYGVNLINRQQIDRYIESIYVPQRRYSASF